jgi:hypothetical protein
MSEVYFEDYSWYIKTTDSYDNTKYLEVVINEEISSINEVFTIMSKNLPYGYTISDTENLYTINDIPCEYWDKNPDPNEYCCFQTISESDWGYDVEKTLDISYFDKIIETF